MDDDVYNLLLARGGVIMSAALDAEGRMTGGVLKPIAPPGHGPQLPIPQIPVDTRGPRQRDEDQRQLNMQSEGGRSYLHTLAEVTGGTVYVADRMENLGAAFSKIAAELRSQYSLGYVSTNQKKDGKYRKVTVKVDVPGSIVKAKKGYYSGAKKAGTK